MKKPFFSVLIVSLNAGDKLLSTVRSVLGQTESDYEILIKDGGSADGSVERLPRDARLRVEISPDAGIYDAMNRAAAKAQGAFFLFLNCGDTLHTPETLFAVRRAIEADGSSEQTIYYGDILEESSGQRVAANPVLDDFACYRNLPCHQACVYGRSFFAERGFDTALRVRADYEHFLYCLYREGARTVYLPLVVANYEGGGFSETKENRRISAKEHRAVTKRYFSPGKRFLYRLALLATLQPLRERLAHGKRTAALYDAVKNTLYGKKARSKGKAGRA